MFIKFLLILLFSATSLFAAANVKVTTLQAGSTESGSVTLNNGGITNYLNYFQTNPVTGAATFIGSNGHTRIWTAEGTKISFWTNGIFKIIQTNGQYFMVSNGNVIASGNFTGNGSGLTNLPAASISTNQASGFNFSFVNASNGLIAGNGLLIKSDGTSGVLIGNGAGPASTYSVYMGYYAGGFNGAGDVVIGYQATSEKGSGANNVALGNGVGRLSSGGGLISYLNETVLLGATARTKGVQAQNEIVIGFGAVGNGTNTVTIGNNAVTNTVLKGNVVIYGGITTSNLMTLQSNITVLGIGPNTFAGPLNVTNTVTANAFVGNGGGLTNLDASKLINASALALTNAGNSFAGSLSGNLTNVSSIGFKSTSSSIPSIFSTGSDYPELVINSPGNVMTLNSSGNFMLLSSPYGFKFRRGSSLAVAEITPDSVFYIGAVIPTNGIVFPSNSTWHAVTSAMPVNSISQVHSNGSGEMWGIRRNGDGSFSFKQLWTIP